MCSKKKGFTLVELLGVIAILGVIALIVTPLITGIISNARNAADLRTAEAYVKAGEDYYTSIQTLNYADRKYNTNIIDELTLDNKDATGVVKVNDVGDVFIAIIINNKCYVKSVTDSIEKIKVGASISACGGNVTKEADATTVVNNAYPDLEIGTDGCKYPNNRNYSYMGGCYLKGKQTNNYLWYSGFLWRIMGINQDGTIRLITAGTVSSLTYNKLFEEMIFDGSNIDSWLNDYFYNNLKNPSDVIVNNNFCEGEAVDTTAPSRTDCTNGTIISRKVGLLSIDEYELSGDLSYLNINQKYWTISLTSNEVWAVNPGGDVLPVSDGSSIGVRPVINIKPSAIITTGNGGFTNVWNSISSPYILNQTMNNITGLLSEKSSSGEYVEFANKIYRVVSHDSSGNTKLILGDFYQEVEGTIYKSTFNGSNEFVKDSGIGAKLNGDVLNWLVSPTDTSNLNKLVTNLPWYQNEYGINNGYINSLSEVSNERTTNVTVGLIRPNEMLATQTYNMLTKNGTTASSVENVAYYWTLHAYYNEASHVCGIMDTSQAASLYSMYEYAIRPVIVIKSDTSITSGNGTPSSPYQI